MAIASSIMGEGLMRSFDQLLRSVAEHQVVVVHVDSSTVGKARGRESGREVMQGARGEAETLRC